MTSDSTRRPRLSRTRISAGRSDTTKIVRTKVDLDNTVDFSAKDSMVLTGRNKAYMYGDGKIVYGSIKLDANEILMDMDSTTVYAVGTPDSIGEIIGNPIFDDNGTSYEAKTMRYNFKTEKGFITDVITQQGEGYLTGGQSKKLMRTPYTCRMPDTPRVTTTSALTSICSSQKPKCARVRML